MQISITASLKRRRRYKPLPGWKSSQESPFVLLLSLRSFEPKSLKACSANSHKTNGDSFSVLEPEEFISAVRMREESLFILLLSLRSFEPEVSKCARQIRIK